MDKPLSMYQNASESWHPVEWGWKRCEPWPSYWDILKSKQHQKVVQLVTLRQKPCERDITIAFSKDEDCNCSRTVDSYID